MQLYFKLITNIFKATIINIKYIYSVKYNSRLTISVWFWFGCSKNRCTYLMFTTNKFIALMRFSKKIGCSIVAPKASSRDRPLCPLGTRWRGWSMGPRVVSSSCWHRGSIFSLSASTDISTDIMPSPSISMASVCTIFDEDILGVSSRFVGTAYSASLLSRKQAHAHYGPYNAPISIRSRRCELLIPMAHEPL